MGAMFHLPLSVLLQINSVKKLKQIDKQQLSIPDFLR
jgi:hypothetical protein